MFRTSYLETGKAVQFMRYDVRPKEERNREKRENADIKTIRII